MLDEKSDEQRWQAPGHTVDLPGVLVTTETRPEGDIIVIVARGELDIATAPVLRRRLLELLALPVGGLAVDLAGVTFMDSSGLDALYEGLQGARGRGVDFTLRHVPNQVRQVLCITNMTGLFVLEDEHEDEDEDDNRPDDDAPPNAA
jgi:anti-anti-sigma factor